LVLRGVPRRRADPRVAPARRRRRRMEGGAHHAHERAGGHRRRQRIVGVLDHPAPVRTRPPHRPESRSGAPPAARAAVDPQSDHAVQPAPDRRPAQGRPHTRAGKLDCQAVPRPDAEPDGRDRHGRLRAETGRRRRRVGDLRLGRVRPRRPERPHRRRHRRDSEEHPGRADPRPAALMTLDPRTPVVVGVAQTQRRLDPAEATEPVDMMVDVLRRAAEDSGAQRPLLERADSIRVPEVVTWPYTDPGALVAARLGAEGAETVYGTMGGNTPQSLVTDAAVGIAAGRHQVVLVVGAEATYTRHRAKKQQVWLEWPKQTGAEPTRRFGESLPGVTEAEAARGLELPIQIYPILETAVRAARRTTVASHRARIAELWSRYSAVATRNPHAWSPRFRTPAEIATPTPDNRMVGFPYTKAMCAFGDTDQAAALILCSVEAARDAGVPEDRWVFPWCGADTHDHWFLSQRADLHSSPGLRAAGRAALG